MIFESLVITSQKNGQPAALFQSYLSLGNPRIKIIEPACWSIKNKKLKQIIISALWVTDTRDFAKCGQVCGQARGQKRRSPVHQLVHALVHTCFAGKIFQTGVSYPHCFIRNGRGTTIKINSEFRALFVLLAKRCGLPVKINCYWVG